MKVSPGGPPPLPFRFGCFDDAPPDEIEAQDFFPGLAANASQVRMQRSFSCTSL